MISSEQLFNTAMNMQCLIAKIELQSLFKSLKNKELIDVVRYVAKGPEDQIIEIEFPLKPISSSLEQTQSILEFDKEFELISKRLLPLLFGPEISIDAYGEDQGILFVAFYFKNIKSFMINRLSSNLELKEVESVNDISDQTLRLAAGIDYIVADIDIPKTFKLPMGEKLWKAIRLRETHYTIDHFQLVDTAATSELIRFQILITPMALRKSNKLEELLQALEGLFHETDAVLDYSISDVIRYSSKYYLDCRCLVG